MGLSNVSPDAELTDLGPDVAWAPPFPTGEDALAAGLAAAFAGRGNALAPGLEVPAGVGAERPCPQATLASP